MSRATVKSQFNFGVYMAHNRIKTHREYLRDSNVYSFTREKRAGQQYVQFHKRKTWGQQWALCTASQEKNLGTASQEKNSREDFGDSNGRYILQKHLWTSYHWLQEWLPQCQTEKKVLKTYSRDYLTQWTDSPLNCLNCFPVLHQSASQCRLHQSDYENEPTALGKQSNHYNCSIS